MKKTLYGLCAALVSAFAFTSCAVDLGTEPGNDTAPHVALYQYAVSGEYDGDCDVALRVAVNNQAKDVYLLAELAADKAARVSKDGEEAYCDYVVKNGQKVNVTADAPADLVLQKVFGENAITVVAVNGDKKFSTETTFSGLQWNSVAEGTYYFANAWVKNLVGAASAHTTLQYLETSPNRYRFKDLFGKNGHLVFTVYPDQKSDNGYTFMRVFAQATALAHSTYGTLSVRDVAAWQGNDGYAGWSNFALEDGFIDLWVQWYVSAGNLGYGRDRFIVDE